MDYKKEYEEMVQRVKELHEAGNFTTKKQMEIICPELAKSEALHGIDIPFGAYDSELKGWEYTIPEGMEAVIKDGKIIVREQESDDERMLRTIIEGFENWKSNGKMTFNFTNVDDILTYLEKQKEQKSAEWSNEDEHRITDAIYFLESAKIHYADISEIEKTIAWLKSFRPLPKQEWSEEDERLLRKLEDYVDIECFDRERNGQDLIDWLRSLRPVSKESLQSWKPSEEQMKALNAINCHGDLSYIGQQSQLISLYNDLKKLM